VGQFIAWRDFRGGKACGPAICRCEPVHVLPASLFSEASVGGAVSIERDFSFSSRSLAALNLSVLVHLLISDRGMAHWIRQRGMQSRRGGGGGHHRSA